MFTSYLQGLLGFILSFIGILAITLLIFSLLAKNLGVFIGIEANEPVFLVAGLGLIFVGGYLRYLSKQTVRNEKR